MNLQRFFPAWFVSALAIAFAALIMGDHMNIGDSNETLINRIITVAIVGLVFTLVHWLVGSILKMLSLPFIIVTLGLLLLVINALLLMLTEWITSQFGIEFFLDGFWWAVLAAIVISLAQSILSAVIGE